MNFLLDFVSKTSKILFFLLIVALSSNSHAQWWTSGGNLIWPYGDVSITKGSLNVGGSLNVTGRSTFLNDVIVSNETYSPIRFRNIDESPMLELNPNDLAVTLGDIDYINAGTKIFVDDRHQLIRLYTADSLLVDCFGTLLIGDASNLQYGTLISVLDENRKVNINADSVNISGNLNFGGIKEYVAFVTWHSSGPPTVNVIKNTLGDTITWTNIDDTGTLLEASANTNVFTINKTSNFSTICNDSDVSKYLIGKRANNTVYSIYSWNAAGDSPVQVDNFQFLFKVSVYP